MAAFAVGSWCCVPNALPANRGDAVTMISIDPDLWRHELVTVLDDRSLLLLLYLLTGPHQIGSAEPSYVRGTDLVQQLAGALGWKAIGVRTALRVLAAAGIISDLGGGIQIHPMWSTSNA